jgi:hypothetical protein
MQYAIALELKEVQVEVTSMSPVFPNDRLSVQRVIQALYRDAKKGLVPYGFINQLKRDLKRIGFSI